MSCRFPFPPRRRTSRTGRSPGNGLRHFQLHRPVAVPFHHLRKRPARVHQTRQILLIRLEVFRPDKLGTRFRIQKNTPEKRHIPPGPPHSGCRHLPDTKTYRTHKRRPPDKQALFYPIHPDAPVPSAVSVPQPRPVPIGCRIFVRWKNTADLSDSEAWYPQANRNGFGRKRFAPDRVHPVQEM